MRDSQDQAARVDSLQSVVPARGCLAPGPRELGGAPILGAEMVGEFFGKLDYVDFFWAECVANRTTRGRVIDDRDV